MEDGFNELGFMGNDLAGWRDMVHQEFPASFAMAYRICRTGMRMISDFPDGDLPESRVLAIAGFYRGFQAFQSAIHLAERGALAEARALARLSCENTIVTGALLKNNGTLEELQEDYAKHCLALANVIIEMGRSEDAGIDVSFFEKRKAEILAEYKEDPKNIKIYRLAQKSGLESLYEIAYRHPSGDGAHATLAALHRHFKKEDDGTLIGMIFHPDKSDLRQTVVVNSSRTLC